MKKREYKKPTIEVLRVESESLLQTNSNGIKVEADEEKYIESSDQIAAPNESEPWCVWDEIVSRPASAKN